MSQSYRKKLIEVALPLEAINIASAREKSIRHGHPSTLHLWWARRPLAACRAVLFASLVDDPDSDPAYAHFDAATREHMAGEKRQQLFDLITELVQWENSNNELIINAARAEIARCVASRKIELGELKKDHKLPGGETVYDLVIKGHGDLDKLRKKLIKLPNPESVNAFLAEHAPPVLDPFCGGGSIPLEAQRLGLRAYASDLNPVPVLINKALIEIPPKFANMPPVNPEDREQSTTQNMWKGARSLAADIRYYGKWMRDEAEKRIGTLYPRVQITAEMAKNRPDLKTYTGDDVTVIAWLWARTIRCPNPACAAQMPLIRSFWLGTKKGKEAWLHPVSNSKSKTVEFLIHGGAGMPAEAPKIGRGAAFKCLVCNQIAEEESIRAAFQAKAVRQQLIATVAEGRGRRLYLAADEYQQRAAAKAKPEWRPEIEMNKETPNLVSGRGYGIDSWHEIFTPRQLHVLDLLTRLLHDVKKKVFVDSRNLGKTKTGDIRLDDGGVGVTAYSEAIVTYLALAIDRLANYATMICTWHSGVKYETITSTFGRQALPMTWDFAEGNPFSDSSGNLISQIEGIASNVERLADIPVLAGSAIQRDATAPPEVQGAMVSCDPPYYDNIAYADLSDFFYLWLRRSLADVFPSLFSTLLTPKAQELIAAPHRFQGSMAKACDFFEQGLRRSFQRMREQNNGDYPITVFYAFKQTEADESSDGGTTELNIASTGWESMLEGLVQAGLATVGTWPMRTELIGNLKKNVGALASSIVIACRSRPDDAALASRREFIAALRRDLPDSLRKLQQGSIAPVDLAQAAIGPGMAVFTQYAKVMEADGSPMKVRQALALINQTLDEVLAEQEGEFDADTRWALAWFEQFSMDEGAFGMAETLSKAKNTAVNALVEAGIVKARGGKVRLVKRDELPDDWNPATDNKVRHWEVTQHLIRRLDTGGETAAAALLRQLGGMGEVARDLAYRLYNLCERKKWPQEALAYNGLVIAWPEISKLAQSQPATTPKETQAGLF